MTYPYIPITEYKYEPEMDFDHIGFQEHKKGKLKTPRNITAFNLIRTFKEKAALNGYPKVITDDKDYYSLIRILKTFTKDQIEDMFDYYFAENMPEKNNKGLGLSIAISKSTINSWQR